MKRTHVLFAIAVLIVIFFGRKALGQPAEESVTLGSIELRLGMAEGIVLERLGEKYDVSEYGRGPYSVWWVREKVKPSRLVGSLGFKEGKLNTVMKYWTPEDTPDTRVGFANSLFSALRAFEREGRASCTISTGDQQVSKYDMKAVFISCGQKYLRIDITKGETGDSANVTEVLEAPKTN